MNEKTYTRIVKLSQRGRRGRALYLLMREKAVEKGTCDQFLIVSNRSIACHVALSIAEEGVCESLQSFLPKSSNYSVPPIFDDVVTSLKLELQATIDAGTNHNK